MYYSSIAQLVEQSAVNRSVVGSSPTRGAIRGPLVKRLRHRPFTAVTRVQIPYGSFYYHRGAEQLAARRAHSPEITGSNPVSAIVSVP